MEKRHDLEEEVRAMSNIPLCIEKSIRQVGRKVLFFALIGLCLAFPALAQYNLLHEFTNGPDDGYRPRGSLIKSGSTLYGMTAGGGSSGLGTIFKIQVDGTGFELLHDFSGGVADGAGAWGSLILSGSTLYGMTWAGGDNDAGTIFKLETDGSGFSLLHEFAGGADDGSVPMGDLILADSTLYGMTDQGGDYNKGTIFKIQTDGSGFSLLHELAGGPTDGEAPGCTLVISGTTLFGVNSRGGAYGCGTVFKIQTDGSGYMLLHEFAGMAVDGVWPTGSLILSGSTLFGMTGTGGSGLSTIFKMQTDGTGYMKLHEFIGGTDDGADARGSLVISGSTLYGMTTQGGDYGKGTIFEVQTDGSSFTLLHEFDGSAEDGAYPYGSLTFSDSILYGMTNYGGDSNLGVIFSLALPAFSLDSPNGWERWNLGETRNITWTAGSYSGTVRLVLFKGGVRFGNIATGVDAASGSFAWTVGQTYDSGMAPAGSDFRMYLRSTDNTLVDPSDYRFALIAPAAQLQLTSPNGGENWPLGSTQNITWNANGYSGTVRLILFKKASKIGQIAASIPASQGSYSWTVGAYAGGTAPAGELYSIRLLAGDGTQEDYSDAPFTITD